MTRVIDNAVKLEKLINREIFINKKEIDSEILKLAHVIKEQLVAIHELLLIQGRD